MSENVTHTGVLDDCFRLMQVSDEICDAFKEVAQTQIDFAQYGGVTRSGDMAPEALKAQLDVDVPGRDGKSV
ncbi:MAG: hypothetical protein QGI83_17355 [Candidatus Latescibacteria bacterium]|jgi:hypothetical protein|nr:hypothetical protein [Candidatus Latescibacterota bacterium]